MKFSRFMGVIGSPLVAGGLLMGPAVGPAAANPGGSIVPFAVPAAATHAALLEIRLAVPQSDMPPGSDPFPSVVGISGFHATLSCVVEGRTMTFPDVGLNSATRNTDGSGWVHFVTPDLSSFAGHSCSIAVFVPTGQFVAVSPVNSADWYQKYGSDPAALGADAYGTVV